MPNYIRERLERTGKLLEPVPVIGFLTGWLYVDLNSFPPYIFLSDVLNLIFLILIYFF